MHLKSGHFNRNLQYVSETERLLAVARSPRGGAVTTPGIFIQNKSHNLPLILGLNFAYVFPGVGTPTPCQASAQIHRSQHIVYFILFSVPSQVPGIAHRA